MRAVALAYAALAAAGCGPRWVYSAAELPAYADAQRQELEEHATRSPGEVVRAALMFREPLAPADVQDLVEAAGVQILYYEWRQVGAETRGGDTWTRVHERAAEYPGLAVTYVSGRARAIDWANLAADPRAWLVDLGGEQNLFDMAVEAGLLAQP